MKFRFSDEHEILRRTVRAFCQQELTSDFPAHGFLSQIQQLGWLAGGTVESAIVFEEAGRRSLPAASLLENSLKPGREGAAILRSAAAIGSAQQAIDDAVRYANERRQFGQPIGKFQAIAHLLVDVQVEADGARWLAYRAAWLADRGESHASEAAMADFACTDALLRATSDALRVFGGYGLTLEFDISHRFREARRFVCAGAS